MIDIVDFAVGLSRLYASTVGLTTVVGNSRPSILSKIFKLVQDNQYNEAQKSHDEYIAPQAIVIGSMKRV